MSCTQSTLLFDDRQSCAGQGCRMRAATSLHSKSLQVVPDGLVHVCPELPLNQDCRLPVVEISRAESSIPHLCRSDMVLHRNDRKGPELNLVMLLKLLASTATLSWQDGRKHVQRLRERWKFLSPGAAARMMARLCLVPAVLTGLQHAEGAD